MASARHYRDLHAWQKAMNLAELVYRITSRYPSDERFGITLQTRRSSVSVPSNIAEGEGRGNDKEFVYFLRVAHGSLCELETQLLLGLRLGYVDEPAVDDVMRTAADVGRLINGLMKSLRRTGDRRPATGD